MALKPAYEALVWETSFFCNSTVERGTVVLAYTGTVGSGQALDSFNQLVVVNGLAYTGVPANPLYPQGILWNTFVNKDLTQQTLNYLKHETQVGDKASIIRKGTVVTNAIYPGSSAAIQPGCPAYLAQSGLITPTLAGATQPQIGNFLSRPDSDGYAKVYINL